MVSTPWAPPRARRRHMGTAAASGTRGKPADRRDGQRLLRSGAHAVRVPVRYEGRRGGALSASPGFGRPRQLADASDGGTPRQAAKARPTAWTGMMTATPAADDFRSGSGRWSTVSAGFVALSYEIVWFRLLGVMVKSTAFTFGTLLDAVPERPGDWGGHRQRAGTTRAPPGARSSLSSRGRSLRGAARRRVRGGLPTNPRACADISRATSR